MPIYNRNAEHPDREPNWWLDYYADGERIREPGCGKNDRASRRLLEMREKEIRLGTWKHPKLRVAEQMTVAQWAERHFAIRHVNAELSPSKRAQQNVHDQQTRVETYVLPKIGSRPMAAVTTAMIKGVIEDLVREARLASRTIHHVYDATRGMFMAAAAGERPIIERNPCTLTTKGFEGGLPKKRDKKPGWRAAATFTHGELRQLFTDERNPIDRRTFWALVFFSGTRFGEAAGRRWRDYDADARPLGRIVCATQYDDRALKGEAPARDIPVHPFLAWMLEQWFADGFELIMGRKPKPEDWLVPSRIGKVRSLKHMAHRLEEDLERIGLRRRTPHNLRAAFISLAQEDGGTRDVLERITHKGNQDVWSGYSRHPWRVLCEHVAMLRMTPPEPPRSHSRSHAASTPAQVLGITRLLQRDGRDLKASNTSELPRNLGPFEERVLEAYLDIRGLPLGGVAPVTSRVTAELAEDLRAAAEAIMSGRPLPGDQRERLAGAVQAVAGALDELAVTLEPAELPEGKSA